MNTLRRLQQFVKKIASTAGMTAPEAQLADDIVVGISKTGSCHLSQIGRALKEDRPLIDTERRLSEELSKPDSGLDDMRDAYVREVAPVAAKKPFIVVDGSDIAKPHGKAFEYLDIVRDGSDKRKVLEPGYWVAQIEATDDQHRNLPLWYQTYSTKDPNYLGWYETFVSAMLSVLRYVGKETTWLFDRGFDAGDFLAMLMMLKITWVVRQMQTRNIIVGNGDVVLMHDFAAGLRKPHATTLSYVCKKTHRMKSYPAYFGYAPIRLPDIEGLFWMIVITGLRKEDIVLLGNAKIACPEDAERIVRAYVRRWGGEEGLRCWKQSTGVEDLRVRSWESVQRLSFFAMMAYGIQALLLTTCKSVAEKLIARVKVFIKDVPFLHYRLWAGVKDALNANE